MDDTCCSHVLGVCGMPICPVPSLTTPYIFVSIGVKFGCFSQQKGAQDARGVHQGQRHTPKLNQDMCSRGCHALGRPVQLGAAHGASPDHQL